MSHFTVTVKLSAERLANHNGDVESALEEILAPFDEQPEAKTYLEFKDTEDEFLEEYETKTCEKVRGPKGKLYWPWDDKFRVKGTFGTGSGTHEVPHGYTKVTLPFKEVYASFEEFCKGYHSAERDEDKKRYGYWRNPNAKWDWWSIGGRWSGFYPLKSAAPKRLGVPGAFDNKPEQGRGDIVRIDELDTDAIATETRTAAEKFYADYQDLLKGKQFGAFEGPRSRAMSLGLLTVVQKTVQAGPNEVAMPWRDFVQPGDNRASWTDVCKLIGRDEFLAQYTDCFNPILTYSALDEDGWHSPGEMGWFGCSSETPEAYLAFKKEFINRFIKTAKPDDVLVVVDCHI